MDGPGIADAHTRGRGDIADEAERAL